MRQLTRTSIELGICLTLIAVLSGCRESTVVLQYEFSPQQQNTYFWDLEAESVLETGSDHTTRRISAHTRVEQVVEQVYADGSASLRTTVTPIRMEVDGSPAPPETAIRTVATITPAGLVTNIEGLSIPLASSSELDVDRLLAEYLPPLPVMAVGIGDEWSAPFKIEGARSRVDLRGKGRLVEFSLAERLRMAHVRIDRSGQIETTQQVGRSEVQLVGNTRVRSDAMIDIDGSVLRGNETTSTSEFKVALAGGAEVGSLRIRISSSLRGFE